MIDPTDLQRLVDQGLAPSTALSVLSGERGEEFEVAAAKERREVDRWLEGLNGFPEDLTPLWDPAPERFYLALDGALPTDPTAASFTLIEAAVEDVKANLTFASSRSATSWHELYRDKSAKTAFRWFRGKPVSPPAIAVFEGQLQFLGGMHRFHLATEGQIDRVPLLACPAALTDVLAILKSAEMGPTNAVNYLDSDPIAE